MMVVRDHLDDILDAAEKIHRYTADMTFEEFTDDEKTDDAVLRNFEVIGEAAKNIPEEFREEHNDVPWSEMAGMRDRLIHGYSSVDLHIVWMTVLEEIPSLISQIRAVSNSLDE